MKTFPIIDIFAGPGGLGEGFSAFRRGKGFHPYRIALSIEKEKNAHETLQLRSFFRQFPDSRIPDDYYQFLRRELSKEELFKRFPKEAEQVSKEAWHATLGKIPEKVLEKRITSNLKGDRDWILIGGPPCQAYSLVGRSRRGGINESDPNVRLYREYLKILGCFRPVVFLMENVKGLLSSRLGDNKIFEEIISHLEYPEKFFREKGARGVPGRYRIFSLTSEPESMDLFGRPVYRPKDFVIPCEKYGIPQARHRIILLGVREDLEVQPGILEPGVPPTLADIIDELPPLRSGLSKRTDDPQGWISTLKSIRKEKWMDSLKKERPEVYDSMAKALEKIRKPRADRGGEFVPGPGKTNRIGIPDLMEWLRDVRIQGWCNHSSRSHISEDLYRYFFAACFARAGNGKSPALADFPQELLPLHKNAGQAVRESLFSDRFRVQSRNSVASTITSHISKDGHYYIHHDPLQCRSLTVREAARLQTFPDNYFFCGPRTAQYIQVGNAVPPYLALQIAGIIEKLLKKSGRD